MKSLVPWVCIVATSAIQGAFASDGIEAYRKGEYKIAAEQLPALSGKDAEADFYLGKMRLYGYGQLKNNTLAIRHFKQAGEKGYLKAQQIMGRYSLLVENNPEQAFYWFKKAADANDVDAQMYCAAASLFGYGVKKNTDAAKRYYTAAAKNGNSIAQYTLADDFLNSKHAQNKKLGLLWLNKAIGQGNLAAQVKLAEIYATGNAVPKDLNKAKELLDVPLAQGSVLAQIKMGEIAEAEKNLPLAKTWYLKAAEKDYIPAQIALSNLYYQTNSPVFDPREGYLWLLKAAQQGSTDAQLALANMYKEGRFVAKNEELVQEWQEEAKESTKENSQQAQKNAAEWLTNGKEKTLAKSGYKLEGIFSDWRNPDALKENIYNQPPQMQEVSREELYQPQFTMISPNEIPINEYYNALSASLGEIKNSYAYPSYPINLNYTSFTSEEGLSPYIAKENAEFSFSFDTPFDALTLLTPQRHVKKARNTTAIKQLYDLAILGDPGAQFTMGQRYQGGVGVNKDIEKAIQFYQLAAAQKDTRSMYALGMLYLEGKEVPRNYEAALMWLNDAAFKGNPYAQFILAELYEKGMKDENGKEVIKQDLPQATSLYFLSATNNYGPAQYHLAELLTREQNKNQTLAEKEQNQKLTKKLYESAVAQGVPEAKLPLAFFNAMDKDATKQLQAFSVAQKEAETGNTQAALLLGLMYDRGLSIPQNQMDALVWYEKAAQNPVSAFILGTYYSDGKLVNKDTNRGRTLLQQASDAGFSYANFNLAILKHNTGEAFLPELDAALALGNSKAGLLLADYYLSTASDEQKMKQAREIFKLFAEKGDKEGQLKYAYMLENGLGGTADIANAQMWYTQSADLGQPIASFFLGRMYQLGKIDKQPNYELAKKWYNLAKNSFAPAAIALGFINETVDDDYTQAFDSYQYAVNQTNPIGALNLGLIYENGKGRAVDYTQAKDLYEQAVVQNQPQAMAQLAGLLVNGSLGIREEQKGYELYRKAAEMGDSDALYHLGLLNETGVGTPLNLSEATNFYQKAAEKGNGKAILALARMYQYGLGVEKNIKKAEELYKTAANLNIPYAQYQLATLYYEGANGAPMPEQGKRLLQQAQENGSAQAKNILQLINAQTEVKTSYIEPLPTKTISTIAQLPADLLYLDAISEWNSGDEASSRKILDKIIMEFPHYTPAKRAYEQLNQPSKILGSKQYTQLNA
ncbi:enhanced entry protein EnhC (plasmid) [Legionella adelaidensis]|uniref:Enhanced entry protein EnhC n=1 Tax=Legionella adelaidensis TaxID=45056 RepID=A0A0W0R2Y1_9GAMM|nr:SEL1-like repeat protein [Legionella adelaidensis]KTC65410.1 enhanced entry protein EnhC [Legionella adelaidensis]VEH84768.1 enhanced entry protein EnhC [Legionella adelaidensis]